MRISKYWKAVVAAVVAGAGSLNTAFLDGTITGMEVGAAVGAVLMALGFTAAVPNKTITPKGDEA